MHSVFPQFTSAVTKLSSRLEFALNICGHGVRLLGLGNPTAEGTQAVDDVQAELSDLLSLLQSVGISSVSPRPAISLPQNQCDIVLRILQELWKLDAALKTMPESLEEVEKVPSDILESHSVHDIISSDKNIRVAIWELCRTTIKGRALQLFDLMHSQVGNWMSVTAIKTGVGTWDILTDDNTVERAVSGLKGSLKPFNCSIEGRTTKTPTKKNEYRLEIF